MTIWKRIKRFWVVLTTEEVVDEHGRAGAGEWYAGRLRARVGDHQGTGVVEGREEVRKRSHTRTSTGR